MSQISRMPNISLKPPLVPHHKNSPWSQIPVPPTFGCTPTPAGQSHAGLILPSIAANPLHTLRMDKISTSLTDPEVLKVRPVKILQELETFQPLCNSVKSPPHPEPLSSHPRCLVSLVSLITPSLLTNSQLSWIKLHLKTNPSLSISTPTQLNHIWSSQEWTLRTTPLFNPTRLLKRNTGHSRWIP
jgi:hypothetical protein